MLPFWILFGYFTVAALTEQARGARDGPLPNEVLSLGLLLTALMIGTRSKGVRDWPAYQYMFGSVKYMGFGRAKDRAAPLLADVKTGF